MANPEHLALLEQGVDAWNLRRLFITPDIEPDLHAADLHKTNLVRINFHRANLRNAILHGANLHGADLREADLREAALSQAILCHANLRKADLCSAVLHGANLQETPLRIADFHRANLHCATLSWADLSQATLSGADLSQAILHNATLQEADLLGANLLGANLHGASRAKATLWGTVFTDTNLAEVKGLDTCHHQQPSYLDFRTLQKSGQLPLAFLRGCGLPDLLIDYLPLLFNQPIQYYSCFISYSSKDEDFAQRLFADLQNKGVRCWFAPDDMKSGREIYEQIGEAIRLHEKLLLVLSEHSMSSKWVETEIIKAQQRAVREKRQVLFPIRLVAFEAIQHWERFDADTGTDLAREVRKYFIPDLSNWKSHDAYQQAFDRLLRDLKLELERKPETT